MLVFCELNMIVHEGVLLGNVKMYLNNTINDLTVTTNLDTHVPHVMRISKKSLTRKLH